MLRKIAVFALASAASLGAQSAKVALLPTSSVTVEGTSNIDAWHATTTTLTSSIEIASPADAGSKVQSVTLTFPVTSLKSGKGGLDKNLYKALKPEKNPTISYRMVNYKSARDSGAYAAVVTGMLTVNGIEKEVVLNARMSGDAKELKAVGSATFKMSDFGIKRVTALLGTIKTRDAVTVKFNLVGAAARGIAQLPE